MFRSQGGVKKVKKPFTLRLENDLIQFTKIQAIKEGRHVNELIESLLRDYLKGVDKYGSVGRQSHQKV